MRPSLFPALAVFTALAFGQAQKAPAPSPMTADEARANQMLTTALAEKNPDTRKEAAAAFSLSAAREPYLTELGSALNDKDIYVRLAALESTVDLRQKGAIPALNKALYDETPEVSFAAAKALYALNDAAGRGALLAVAGGEVKPSTGTVAAKEREMARLFQTPRNLMLFAFRQGLDLVPVPGVGAGVSSVTLILSDSGVSGRAAAILLLAHDKNSQVLPALREALKDKDTSVRAAAVHSIALHDDPAYAGDLLAAMTDAKESVRFRAAAGYIRLAGMKGKVGAKGH